MIKKFVISKLLYLANQRPDFICKPEFYQLKDKLIKKYGKKIGTDYQYIEKECFTCNGTGVYADQYKRETCNNCFGTGKYDEFVSQLDKYKIGKHEFHLPVKRYYRYSSGFIGVMAKVNIKGYIRHNCENPYLCDEAKLWLFLLFNKKTFRKIFGRSYRFDVKCRYLLLSLSNLKYAAKHKDFKNVRKKNVPVTKYSIEQQCDELPF